MTLREYLNSAEPRQGHVVSDNIQMEWSETQQLKDRTSCPWLVDKKYATIP